MTSEAKKGPHTKDAKVAEEILCRIRSGVITLRANGEILRLISPDFRRREATRVRVRLRDFSVWTFGGGKWICNPEVIRPLRVRRDRCVSSSEGSR